MAFIKNNLGLEIEPGIAGRLIMWAISKRKLSARPNVQLTVKESRTSAEMYLEIHEFLTYARCQSPLQFMGAIGPALKELECAILQFSQRVRDNSYLFLDLDGNPQPRSISFDNPSSDAD